MVNQGKAGKPGDNSHTPFEDDADRVMQATARLVATTQELVEELYRVYDRQAELHQRAQDLLRQLKEMEQKEDKLPETGKRDDIRRA